MFHCTECKRMTKPGEPQTLKVLETRERIYKEWKKGVLEVSGTGTEIVVEVPICTVCAGISSVGRRWSSRDLREQAPRPREDNNETKTKRRRRVG